MSYPMQKDKRHISRDRTTAQLQVRLFDPVNRSYLHMSGQGLAKETTWSWRGYRYQANVLRRRALNAGKDWPFTTVPADEIPAPADLDAVILEESRQ